MIQKTEVLQYIDEDTPCTITLIPSGRPDKYLEVYEDPFEYSVSLTTKEDFEAKCKRADQMKSQRDIEA